MSQHRYFTAELVGRSVLFVLVLALSSCTSLLTPGEQQQVQIYLLEAEEPLASSTPQLKSKGPSIVLATARADPGYTGSQMLYIQVPHRLDAFAYHRWADPPARMLEPLIRLLLESEGRFSQVASGGSRARGDLRLETELIHLHQRFDVGGGSTLELAVRFTLTDWSAGVQRGTKVISIREPATDGGPYGGVVAANRAVNRMLRELQAFIADALNGS